MTDYPRIHLFLAGFSKVVGYSAVKPINKTRNDDVSVIFEQPG